MHVSLQGLKEHRQHPTATDWWGNPDDRRYMIVQIKGTVFVEKMQTRAPRRYFVAFACIHFTRVCGHLTSYLLIHAAVPHRVPTLARNVRHVVMGIYIEQDGSGDDNDAENTRPSGNGEGGGGPAATLHNHSTMVPLIMNQECQALARAPRSFERSSYTVYDTDATPIEEASTLNSVRSAQADAGSFEELSRDVVDVRATCRAYKRIVGEELNAEAFSAMVQKNTRQQLSALACLLETLETQGIHNS